MQQQTAAIKQKKQNDSAGKALFALIITAACIFVWSTQSRMLDIQTKQLLLTPQGCSYLTSLGLTTKQEPLGCSIIVRYSSSGLLDSDREILLGDNRFISLSSAAIVAVADTDQTLPNTTAQRRALYIVTGVFAAVIALLIMMIYATIKD